MEYLQQPENMKLEGDLRKNWLQFKEDWQIYAVATGCMEKSTEIQAATLLHCVGKETREILRNTEVSSEEMKDSVHIIKKLDDYFIPKTNKSIERHRFNNRVQMPGENFDSFIGDLRKLAKNCDFGGMKEELLTDRIVCGIRESKVKNRLLQETELTLEKAIIICKSAEITESHLKEFTHKNQAEIGAINKTSPRNTADKDRYTRQGQKNHRQCGGARQQVPAGVQGDKSSRPWEKSRNNGNNSGSSDRDQATTIKSNVSNNRFKCNRCNFVHASKMCPAFGKICHKCNGKNHFARNCLSKKINVLESNNEQNETYLVGSISKSIDTKDEFWININFNDCENKYISFKIDTGAQTNVIPEYIFKTLNLNNYLKQSNVKITNYGGSQLRVLGECKLNCKVNNMDQKIDFVIIKTDHRTDPVIGISTINDLKILKINQIKVNENLSEIIQENNDLFEGIGEIKIKPYQFKLKTNYKPHIAPIRQIPFQLVTPLKEELDSMVNDGIIAPITEPTEFVNPIVIVKKPNNKLRICLDPKNLNEAIQREHYKIPTFDELTQNLKDSKYFTILDANKGFWQIRLNEKASKLTTFATQFGRFRFLRLPFGLSCAPEIFQKTFSNAFLGISGIGIYFDDLIIHAKSLEEHNLILKQVLERARDVGIKFNKQKCKFAIKEINFVGHKLTEDGIKPDENKIKALTSMNPPKDKKELSRFLGMITYVSKFIPNVSKLTYELRQLLRNNVVWEWSDIHQKAFEALKNILTREPVLLAYFDEKEPITLSVDSSQNSLGAVILQKGKPLAYASKALNKSQSNYAQIEKEALAILFGCQRFHQYLYGKPFLIETDHKPLESIFKKSLEKCPLRLQRILIYLQQYEFTLKYKPGKLLYFADALSRNNYDEKDFKLLENDIELQVNLIKYASISPQRFTEIETETKNDLELNDLLKVVMQGWPLSKKDLPNSVKPYWKCRGEIYEAGGLLIKANQIIIPQKLRGTILDKLHYGHMGINKTILKAKEVVYWPFMTQQIADVIQKCFTCAKYQNSNQKEPIVDRELPYRPWEAIAADFFHFNNLEYLLIVDMYSKYPEIACLKNNTTSDNVIHNFKSIIARHGKPNVLYSDNGPQFVNAKFQNFLREWEIPHKTSSPHFAQSNGFIERHIQTIKKLLKKALEEGKDMYLVLMEYRATPISGKLPSPAEILFNRKIKTQLPIQEKLLCQNNTQNYRSVLKQNQIRQKKYFNNRTKALPQLKEGDRVTIKTEGNTWKPGRITGIDKHRPRAYKVTFDDNNENEYIRNRKFIRKFANEETNIRESDLYDEMLEELIKGSGTTTIPEETDGNPDLDDGTTTNNDASNTTYRDKRPVRNKRPPTYLKDYKY